MCSARPFRQLGVAEPFGRDSLCVDRNAEYVKQAQPQVQFPSIKRTVWRGFRRIGE